MLVAGAAVMAMGLVMGKLARSNRHMGCRNSKED
jgi:hypothetical protein